MACVIASGTSCLMKVVFPSERVLGWNWDVPYRYRDSRSGIKPVVYR